MRRLQIGVMGSASDLNYEKDLEQIAEEVGAEIAQRGGILFFGAEKDYDSLSTAACRGAKRFDGLTVGVTYGKGKDIYQDDADVIISTGAERGGPRESVLVLSCDAVIAVSGRDASGHADRGMQVWSDEPGVVSSGNAFGPA